MHKKSLILLSILVALLYGCTGSEIEKKTIINKEKSTEKLNSRLADEHFINGNLSDMKGEYAAAILEYQDALSLEKNASTHYALAKDYLLINKLYLALQNANSAIQLDSTNIEFYNLLAEIYTVSSMKDSAITTYEKIISKDSTEIQAYYSLAVLYEQSSPSKAVNIYEKLLDITGPEWTVLVRLAELNEKLGKQDKSVAALEQLTNLDPSNTDLKKVLIESYLKMNKDDEAMSTVDDLLKYFPDDPSLIELKAQVYLKKDDWANAAKEYSILLKRPEIPLDTKIRIGTIYLARSTSDSSLVSVVKNLFTTIDNDTTDWQVKMVLGEIALREKNDSVAINNFKKVIDLARWNGEAWIRLGGLYFDHKKYDEAVDLMREAINSFPDNFVINLILGLSLSQVNNHSEAKIYLEKAVNLNPNDVTALSAYGYTLNQLKQPEEAINMLSKAIKIDPQNVDLLGTIGLIYNAQKKFNESDSVYSKALQIDSNNALVNNNFAYSLAERGFKLNDALKMAQKAISKDSLNSSYLDTIGWVHFQLGNYTLAKKFVQKAIDIDSKNATILEHLGDIAFKTGETSRAMEMWKKALELSNDNSELKTKIEKGTL